MYKDTLREYLEGKSLFSEIENIESFTFLSGEDLTMLDTLLKFKYGMRPLYSPVKDMSIPDLATAIVLNFSDAWNQYIELSNIPFANSSSETIETLTGSENRVQDNSTKHKVSAFNDPSMVDEYEDKGDNVEDNLREYEKTINRKDFSDEKLSHLYELTKKSTLNRVLFDVAAFTTLGIY